MANCSVLFAREDSIYKSISGCDVWDISRDARNYCGPNPVVAHPPCRGWGRLRMQAKPRPDEKDLAVFAIGAVRSFGGVLEHPAYSSLWPVQSLPHPGKRDQFGGFTLPLSQCWFGHKAEKKTWLYVCGVEPGEIPDFPLCFKVPSHVVAKSKGRRDRPELSKKLREATPPDFAEWLCELAVRCGDKLNTRCGGKNG